MPEVDPKTYRLQIDLENGGKPVDFDLEKLKTNFEHYTLTVAIQCAGNRRDEMNVIKKVKGLTWAEGAIGNAKWTGVKLRDVLMAASFKESSDFTGKHVQFEGLDMDVSKAPYGASILLGKALDPSSDVLIAFAMISRSDHNTRCCRYSSSEMVEQDCDSGRRKSLSLATK